MLEKLEKNKSVPKPSRDEIMAMTCTALENVSFDKERAFKSLFLTNSLDGKEDYLVSDKLFSLVGKSVQNYRKTLMNQPCPKNLQELLKTITFPKGVKRKNNIEGSELYDCEGPEIEIEQQNEEFENFDSPENETKAALEENKSKSSTLEPLSGSSSNATIERDCQLIDGILKVLQDNPENSLLLRPFVSQFKVTVDKARRSLKRRIDYDNQLQIQNPVQTMENSQEDEIPQFFDLEVNEASEIKPKVGEHWSVKNCQNLYVIIETENPISVKYFQPSVKGEYHRLNDTVYEILTEDLGKKISAPKIKNLGKFRQFYQFE